MNSLIIKLQDRINGLFPGLIVVGTIAAAWLADAVNLAKPDGVIAVSEHTGVINTATEISTIQ